MEAILDGYYINGRKSMKRSVKILLVVLAALVVAVSVVVYLQWNNITAAKYYLSSTEDELSEKISENDKRLTGIMDELVPNANKVRDLTDDEKNKLASDELTPEEAVQILVNDYKAPAGKTVGAGTNSVSDAGAGTNASPAASEASSASASGTEGSPAATASSEADPSSVTGEAAPADSNLAAQTNPAASTGTEDASPESAPEDTVLAGLVAEAYVLRAQFTGRLEGLKSSAAAEFKALGKDEQTQEKKMEIGMKYMDRAGKMEGECDGKMDNLVARIEKQLRRTGGDTSIINDIKAYYAEEKSVKKAYYLSKYK